MGTQASCATDEPGEPTSQQRANPTAITDALENTKPEGSRLPTTFTYNPFGQPLTVTDPLGHTTTHTCDARTRRTTERAARRFILDSMSDVT
jgi:YD repeat-containing protein